MKAYHLSTAKKHLQQATDNDIVVADLRLPDGSGIDLLCWMRKEGKMQPFIIMTDYAEVNTAVESMKLGSIDYIPKQLVEDKLVPLIRSPLLPPGSQPSGQEYCHTSPGSPGSAALS